MKQKYRGSLALRVLGISLVVFALPMMLYFWITFAREHENMLLSALGHVYTRGKVCAAWLSDARRESNQDMVLIEADLKLRENPPKKISKELSQRLKLLAESWDFISISYYAVDERQQGFCAASSIESIVGEPFKSRYWGDSLFPNGVSTWIDYDYGHAHKEPLLVSAKLVYSEDGKKVVGALRITRSLVVLMQQFLTAYGESFPVQISVLTRDHMVLASTNPKLVYLAFEPPPGTLQSLIDYWGPQVWTEDLHVVPVPEFPGVIKFSFDKSVYVAAWFPIEGTQVSFLLNVDQKVIYGPFYSGIIAVIIVFIVILGIGGGIAFWLTQRMSKPLRSLEATMNRIGQGDLTARFQESRMGFEINELGKNFNQMIVSLVDQIEQVKKERVQKEILGKELKIGHDIQRSILPRENIQFPGVDLAGRYVPAQEVGGDFYDIFVKEDLNSQEKQLVLTVADASGKGISACLYSLCLRSMIRSYSVNHDSVAAIMWLANNLFMQDTGDTGMFVTALTALFDPKTLKLSYYSCGHNPGFVVHKDGRVSRLENPGIAMGVIDFEDAKDSFLQLERGDLVVLYTDGVTEAHNMGKELFGEKRLLECLLHDKNLSANEMAAANEVANGVLQAVNAFVGRAPQHDDITLLIMRVL